MILRSLALLAVAAAPLAAQAPAAASADDRAAVLGVVKQLFDAMRAGDSAAVRAVFHPRAQLGSALIGRDGAPQVRLDSLANFIKAVGTPHAEVWDERTDNETVHVDGPLAVAWTPYAFYAGKTFSHCGVNSFQLARTAEGWRIVSLVDTRQRTGCPQQAAPK
ncbi:nuclear transport factor 2 family protein [Roseisolibacter sp. H3M3-2]|uniref:nuclear transport factor 2 family protein n=1 Tax=Roseisolibacter sp. H3M3-2 TaxID=3031323 RepID=UPI0023DB9193|nr:nuclear transport factor 2 family protein [Roseisolibacter sp. H3M3-2]MDF1501615.1 nuclear transport factor 2 family protein [Roseisolibacter sp. H3M3-2]